MKIEPKIVVFFIFIGSLFTYLYLKNNWSEKFSPQNQPVLPRISVNTLEKVEFDYNSQKTILEKVGDKFVVAGEARVPADEPIVAEIIGSLNELVMGETASENKDKWSIFEVDEKAIHLRLRSSGVDYEIWIGKHGPDFQSTYLRVGPDPKTYLSPGNVRNVFLKDDYRSKIVLDIKNTQITEFTLNSAKISLKARKEDNQWKDASLGNLLDETKVNNFLNQFSPLKAEDIVLAKEVSNQSFDRPYLSIALKTGNQDSILNIIKSEHPEAYLVQRRADSLIFKVSSQTINALPKSSPDLQK